MKSLYVLVICIAALGLLSAKPAKEGYYYFCISRSGDTGPDGNPIKRTVLYSKISLLNSDKSALKLKAKQWGEWVGNHCASKTPCTSDTNFYETEEEAEKAYAGYINAYSDTTKYLLQLVDFR